MTLTSDDGSVTEDSPLDRWGKFTFEAGDAMGKDFRIHEQIKGYLDVAGFESVTEVPLKVPIGSWSEDPRLREIGRWNQVYWLEGIEGRSLDLFTRILGVRSPHPYYLCLKLTAMLTVVSSNGTNPPQQDANGLEGP